MESELVLGFKEATSSEFFGEGNHKLVPWISWDDWNFVRESLFSSSPNSIDFALRRISAWRSRGCLPVMIEVTASIVEIQQKDSSFRDCLSENDLLAEDMLTMLYCMTIMRLVNGIVEKTRKKNEVSIGEAADVIGIPRMLIDIRHECSHRDLPSLRLVRLASTKALDWLKSYYWDPQKMAIPYGSDITANFRKEIKSKIRELVFSLDAQQATRSSSSVVKGKRSKKHINKALKNLVKLYSSFSLEVVSILLEFLLKALETADTVELPNSSQVSNSEAYNTRLDDWKPLIIKLSNKEPEMLLSLLKALLQMIEAHKALKYNSGGAGFDQTEHLSCIFEWLVGNLKDSQKEVHLSNSSLVALTRKCLMVSSVCNNHLTNATLFLVQKMATSTNNTLVQKFNKLVSLHAPLNHVNEIEIDPESFYNEQENSLREATEFLKQKRNLKKRTEKKDRWSMATSWNACPIGMLPCDVASSGVFPVLDIVDEQDKLAECNEKIRGSKREADNPVFENCGVKMKKMKESDDDTLLEGVNGSLMIDGVWKRVTQEELDNISSAVRILI